MVALLCVEGLSNYAVRQTMAVDVHSLTISVSISILCTLLTTAVNAGDAVGDPVTAVGISPPDSFAAIGSCLDFLWV